MKKVDKKPDFFKDFGTDKERRQELDDDWMIIKRWSPRVMRKRQISSFFCVRLQMVFGIRTSDSYI